MASETLQLAGRPAPIVIGVEPFVEFHICSSIVCVRCRHIVEDILLDVPRDPESFWSPLEQSFRNFLRYLKVRESLKTYTLGLNARKNVAFSNFTTIDLRARDYICKHGKRAFQCERCINKAGGFSTCKHGKHIFECKKCDEIIYFHRCANHFVGCGPLGLFVDRPEPKEQEYELPSLNLSMHGPRTLLSAIFEERFGPYYSSEKVSQLYWERKKKRRRKKYFAPVDLWVPDFKTPRPEKHICEKVRFGNRWIPVVSEWYVPTETDLMKWTKKYYRVVVKENDGPVFQPIQFDPKLNYNSGIKVKTYKPFDLAAISDKMLKRAQEPPPKCLLPIKHIMEEEPRCHAGACIMSIVGKPVTSDQVFKNAKGQLVIQSQHREEEDGSIVTDVKKYTPAEKPSEHDEEVWERILEREAKLDNEREQEEGEQFYNETHKKAETEAKQNPDYTRWQIARLARATAKKLTREDYVYEAPPDEACQFLSQLESVRPYFAEPGYNIRKMNKWGKLSKKTFDERPRRRDSVKSWYEGVADGLRIAGEKGAATKTDEFIVRVILGELTDKQAAKLQGVSKGKMKDIRRQRIIELKRLGQEYGPGESQAWWEAVHNTYPTEREQQPGWHIKVRFPRTKARVYKLDISGTPTQEELDEALLRAARLLAYQMFLRETESLGFKALGLTSGMWNDDPAVAGVREGILDKVIEAFRTSQVRDLTHFYAPPLLSPTQCSIGERVQKVGDGY